MLFDFCGIQALEGVDAIVTWIIHHPRDAVSHCVAPQRKRKLLPVKEALLALMRLKGGWKYCMLSYEM